LRQAADHSCRVRATRRRSSARLAQHLRLTDILSASSTLFERRVAVFRTFASVLLVLFVALFAPVAEGTQKGRLEKIMIDKLRYSQGLLQGIALADFPKIISSAEELLTLSKTAEWLANKAPRYEGHNNNFQQAAETIIQKAKARNIDGVVLAYQDLTMSCVRCHQHLREVRDARAPSVTIDPTVLVRR
jgi:hypothetical protein